MNNLSDYDGHDHEKLDAFIRSNALNAFRDKNFHLSVLTIIAISVVLVAAGYLLYYSGPTTEQVVINITEDELTQIESLDSDLTNLDKALISRIGKVNDGLEQYHVMNLEYPATLSVLTQDSVMGPYLAPELLEPIVSTNVSTVNDSDIDPEPFLIYCVSEDKKDYELGVKLSSDASALMLNDTSGYSDPLNHNQGDNRDVYETGTRVDLCPEKR